MVLANRAAGMLTAGLPAEVLGPPMNVFRVCLHPDGLAPRTRNFAEWSTYLLGQLHRPSLLTSDPELAALTAEIERRAALIESVWSTDGRLVDPPLAAAGRAGISDLAAALQGQFPGHTFRRASGVDAHHDQLRFAWELVGPDGAVALTGLDVGEVAPDGRLVRITGFFGDVPALAAV